MSQPVYKPRSLLDVSEKKCRAIVGAFYVCTLDTGDDFLLRVMEHIPDEPQIFARGMPIVYVYGLLDRFSPIPTVLPASSVWIGPLKLATSAWTWKKMRLVLRRGILPEELLPVHAFGYRETGEIYDSRDRRIPVTDCKIGDNSVSMDGAFADELYEHLEDAKNMRSFYDPVT